MAKCRQNYHEECEALINKQISIEQGAYNQYMALYVYFDRDDVALKGFAKLFKHLGEEENEDAQKLIEYQNLRGGRVILKEISAPAVHEWDTPLAAIEFALELEKQVNKSLLNLHKVAGTHQDPHLEDYLEKHFLQEKVEHINKLAKHHTNLLRVEEGLGVFMLDRELES